MSSLLKLIKEDYRRRQLTSAELKLEDILKDIEENPVKFSIASSLTDDRQWIHFVAQQGAPGPLRRLIECGSDIHARDAIERTPLHHAAFNRTDDGAECCRILLDAGALPNVMDCMGYTPLHFACMMENAAAIHVLGSHQADLHASGPSGFTGLHILAQSETSIACIDTLLRLGAAVNVYDETQRTPIDIARERGAFRVLKRLHAAVNQEGQAKYLFRDEARDVGKGLAERRLSISEALPQLMFALATGQNPSEAAKPWAGMEAKDGPVAAAAASGSAAAAASAPPAAKKKARAPGELGKNTYWEESTSSEDEISKYTGVALFKKDGGKTQSKQVETVDESKVGQYDYSRAQAGRDEELLSSGPTASSSQWVEGEHYDA